MILAEWPPWLPGAAPPALLLTLPVWWVVAFIGNPDLSEACRYGNVLSLGHLVLVAQPLHCVTIFTQSGLLPGRYAHTLAASGNHSLSVYMASRKRNTMNNVRTKI